MRKMDKVDRAMKWAIIWSLIIWLSIYFNDLSLLGIIGLCIKCALRFGVFFVLFWLFFTVKEKMAWWFSFH